MARYTRNDRREARNAHLRRGQRHRPDRQLPVPEERRRHLRSHLDAERQLAVGRPRRLAAVPRAERPAARGHLRSGVARVLAGGRRAVRRRAVFPALRLRHDSATSATTSPATRRTRSTRSSRPTRSWSGNHSIRAGYDLRLYHEFGANPGRQAGDYLTRNARRVHARSSDNSAAQNFQDVASFLTGFPTGGSIELNGDARRTTSGTTASSCRTTGSSRNRLTLNLGLRYDYEGAPTEIENRNVRGFDPNATLSITTRGGSRVCGATRSPVPASAWQRARRRRLFASDSTPGILERRQEQHPAARRVRLQVERQDRHPRRAGASTRRRSSSRTASTRWATRSRRRSPRRRTTA